MSSDYLLIRTRRRTIALIVQRDGSLVVRAPLRASEKVIRQFVDSKSEWISKKQAQAQREARALVREYVDGEKFLYLGRAYPLRISARARPALALKEHFELAGAARQQAQAVFTRWYRARAAEVISGRVAALAQETGFRVQKVRISSARTRWGSCSPLGTLSFTWRLVMAPLEIIDYVILHELVHLEIRNHSGAFWARVGELLPDYRTRRAWLRKNGRFLNLESGSGSSR
ncbi:MAG: M48 family metallopeptidase [Anaerolineales bacterium]|nr:M48 family metallopeptidase [Anaerolineales bacterium]